MRIIKPATARGWMRQHSAARSGLEWWLEVVCYGSWGSLVELRRTFPSADSVKTASGRQVIVFNISGNAFRLIAAVHFNTRVVYALLFMTHAEYSKDRWKSLL